MKLNKKTYKKALTLSMCLLVIWAILGTGTSIAWFMDETPVARNIFNIEELDLEVYHKTKTGYEKVEPSTKVFDENALYEPGYTQVVYLKIANEGQIDFDYKLSVIPDLQSLVVAKNVFGQDIFLPKYLRFGVVVAETESQLQEQIQSREAAQSKAVLELNSYMSEAYNLKIGKTMYTALIVWMPETVGNEANYRGNTAPSVNLGLTVRASQEGTLQ